MASVKSLKKGVGSGVRSRSGSINQRYGFVDPDPHQNVTDGSLTLLLGFIVFFSDT